MNLNSYLFLFCLFFWSCDLWDDEDCETAPSPCRKNRPDSVELKILVSLSPNNPPAKLKIYSGNIDKDNLVLEDSALVQTKGYLLPEGYYAVRAIYIAGKDTLEILEGGEINIEVKEYCGGVNCYKTFPNTIDLRLTNLPDGVKWP